MTRQKKSKIDDPHAAREARRYSEPIASRELILKVLTERGELMKSSHLAEALGLTGARPLEALRRRLQAMVRDGQLIRNRRGGYGLAAQMDLVAGRVIGHSDGYGFVALDSGGDDWYLSPREMRQVMHGDRVMVRVRDIDHRGRCEATIVGVLERAISHLVGRFQREAGAAFVLADEKRIAHNILIPPGEEGEARAGDFVYLELTEQPDRRHPPVGKVLEVLGRSINAPMATEVAIRNYDLPVDWPPAADKAADKIPDHVGAADSKGRRDLRSTALVTIDGADARDFDDAVYCEPRPKGGWRLLVAIADVSHYVRRQSALDQEAAERGTSAYFPNRVVPMLPEALSNGICSLNPAVDRLCLACEMQIDADGRVQRSRFFDAVMHSHARLTYAQAWEYLSGRAQAAPIPAVTRSLDALHQLYRALRQRREARGAIDFRGREVGFQFDSAGEVAAIVPRQRNDAHRLIEECMILANVEAARHLLKHRAVAPFRVHPPPPEHKLEGLRLALAELGLKLPAGDPISPAVLARLLAQAEERPDRDLIEALVLRSLALAVYQSANHGHFGLALEAYTHFTSPIRRYPDLPVHRALKLTYPGSRGEGYERDEMARLAEHASMTERRAEEAARDVDERLKCAFMQAHIGDEFSGRVTGVKEFGLFVELDSIQVSGLVHVTMLPNDYYQFDPVSHTLGGKRRGRVFRLADPVRVQVVRVDLDDRQIDLKIAKEPA